MCLFVSKDRWQDVPDDAHANATVVSSTPDIPPDSVVVISTCHKLGSPGELRRQIAHLGPGSNGSAPFDVLFVDEAWQIAHHLFDKVAKAAPITVGVGDVGQLPPLEIGANPWRGDPGYNPYRAWPTSFDGDDRTCAVELPAVWRPAAGHLALWRAFYPEWSTLNCVAAPEDRWLTLDRSGGTGANIWKQVGTGVPTLEVDGLPEPEAADIDLPLMGVVESLVDQLLGGGLALHQTDYDDTGAPTGAWTATAPGDQHVDPLVAILATRNQAVDDAADVVERLRQKHNLSDDDLVSSTVDAYQGQTNGITVAVHPLTGAGQLDEFNSAFGRLAVTCTRATHGLLMVTRPGLGHAARRGATTAGHAVRRAGEPAPPPSDASTDPLYFRSRHAAGRAWRRLNGASLSRLNDLIRQLQSKDPALADDIEREVAALADRRAFGLNFERHIPEAVDLPGRRVRRGDKVRVIPPRGASTTKPDDRLWRVNTIKDAGGERGAGLESLDGDETTVATVADLVVVAEFRDPIYPGMQSIGRVERGGDKPFHTVINAENFHALQTLLFTHRGKIDCIYIDPPYNSGARDWKYNNDYVEADDIYRHSKWLAFMERRLLLAKELLNPADSVLIVTIDEKEYLRLGLLLEQILPEAWTQMVSTVTNPAGAGRAIDFARTDEYIFFLRLGSASVLPEDQEAEQRPVTWDTLRRSDLSSVRHTRPGQFYPIYVNADTHRIAAIGRPLLPHEARDDAPTIEGCVAVFPVRPDGTEMNWGITADPARKRLADGFLRVGKLTPTAPQPYVISYLTSGIIHDIQMGRVEITGRAADASVKAHYVVSKAKMPTTNWNRPSHDAQRGGTGVLRSLMPDRRFPFPKSLYAVEDCLRLFIAGKPDAIVLDFFAGSGTTAHAVMRLNRQDGGQRQCILVTNNEVSADEQSQLRAKGFRPRDADWEALGICDHITRPRIEASILGRTPNGEPIDGDYRFSDEFPMRDGFEENAEFFTLTYEAPLRVASQREFDRIAPLLWMRAGSRGRLIDDVSKGWDVTVAYGVLADLDHSEEFVEALAAEACARMAFVVTDEDRLFESVVRELPDRVEPVRLYEAYLRNFEIESRRAAR